MWNSKNIYIYFRYLKIIPYSFFELMFMNTVHLERKEIQSQNQAKIKNLKEEKGDKIWWGITGESF